MNQGSSADRVFWAVPLLIGLLIVFAGAWLGAMLLSSGRIGANTAPFAAYLPLVCGCLIASFWGAHRVPSHRFPLGFLVGMCIPFCLLLLGITQQTQAFIPAAIGMTVGTAALTSLLGALIGAAVRRN